MTDGVSESRFNMWRAVFAMIHADHEVTKAERDFIENYMATVPFTEAQRRVIADDIMNAKDVAALFGTIEDIEDRGTFFQFARELVWCDGDKAAQEEAIKKQLLETQMFRLNLPMLEQELRNSRAELKAGRDAEMDELRREAREIVGMGAVLRGMARGQGAK